MNYYEELDVSPGASASEIRHAYKSLARLLHPDQCSDENLRRLAELQMRRLNEILTVLTDPEARRRYDACLKAPVAWRRSEVEPQPSVGSTHRNFQVALWAWLAAAAVAVLVLVALLYYGTETRPDAAVSTPADKSVDRLTASRATFSPGAPAPLPVPPKPRYFEGHKAFAQLEPVEGDWPAATRQPAPKPPPPLAEHDARVLEPSPAAEHTSPEPPLPVSSERAVPPVERAAPSSPRLAGHWYYVPASRAAATDGVYLPEYIELRLLESGGVLAGHYVARYRVTDRAIDPNVVFEFEGAGAAPDAQFTWNGPGGATGNVSLRLAAADRLEVSWLATRLSGELNLASGNAQLIRLKER